MRTTNHRHIVSVIILITIGVIVLWSIINIAATARHYHNTNATWLLGFAFGAANAISVYVLATAKTASLRRPAILGSVVVMLIGISALVTAGWLLFVVGTGLLNMLGHAVGGLVGATAGIAGWLGTNVSPVAAALAAGLPGAIWGIVRGLAIFSLWGAGGYIVWHGVQYAIAEQRHRHALQAQRAMTVVEYANRLAEPTHTMHLLPVAQQDGDGIAIEAKEYQRIGR